MVYEVREGQQFNKQEDAKFILFQDCQTLF